MKGRTGEGPHRFGRFALVTSETLGSPWAFLTALAVVLVWAITGPVFQYSDTWQLWINTGTTVVTFLMVFVVQYTQNRDARSMHIKLDELLRAVKGARTDFADLKGLSDNELRRLEEAFDRLAQHAKHARSAAATARETIPRHQVTHEE